MLGNMRAAVLFAALMALGLAGCGDGDSDGTAAEDTEETPQTYTILAGGADASGPDDVALLDFYPSEVRVHPGDVIRLDNGSGAVPVPHTVTLGTGADVPARLPPPLAPGVGQVPAAWGVCVTAEPITPEATSCPDGSDPPFPPEGTMLELPAFAGQGFYNSGIFDKGQSVQMPLAADAEPGSYTFFCYLHPVTMELAVEVVEAEEPTQTQETLDQRADDMVGRHGADGVAAATAADGASRPVTTIQAGAEQGTAVVTRFFPSALTVRIGETVTWVNPGFDPHVVALGQTVAHHDPKNFAPPTLPPGGDYEGGFAISGLFGQPPFPMESYAVRFTEPGRYEYFCPIHPGMSGTVEVT